MSQDRIRRDDGEIFHLDEVDLIVGIHSILNALENTERTHIKIVATDDGLMELKKKYQKMTLKNLKDLKIKVDILSSHSLQESAKKIYQSSKLDFTRVPSGVYLLTSKLKNYSLQDLWSFEAKRVLALDQISDVHNGAAILRTADFFGVGAVILPQEKSFGLTPSFYRIASGAAEKVKIIRVTSMSRAVSQMNDKGFVTIALSEHAENPFHKETQEKSHKKTCLILGKEETGISHAVLRNSQYNLSLRSQGGTQSLNVSAAAAIALEKCFGI